MSRITHTFKQLKTKNRKGLIPFIMGGDPDFETSLAILKSLPKAGADLIEIGMAFSDPVADGETIQRAGQRALKNGINLKKTLKMVELFRKENQDTPIILMGYSNPLHAYTESLFFSDAKQAGVDGVLIVDTPPEEEESLVPHAKENAIDLIRLATPTTNLERLKKITHNASGFLYYVSIAGVTGTKSANIADVRKHVEELKTQTDLPLAIGFGIKTPKDIQNMSEFSDAVIVGSALIQTIETTPKELLIERLGAQISALSKALD